MFATELSRKGPGLMLRDILRDDPQVAAVAAIVARADADVLLLTGIDYDHGGVALAALADRFAVAGAPYPHRFAAPPNTGLPTGFDLDGDGRHWRARDAQGYGTFRGQDGLAIFSRLPIVTDEIRDFSELLWRDLPGARMPQHDGAPFWPEPVRAVQRLSHTAHWVVPVALHGGDRLHLLAFAATPPLFDGEEDRNGLRNADEIRFWQLFLDGAFGPPPARFVLAGKANLDPEDGDGLRGTIRALLADPRVQDPSPSSRGGAADPSPGHRGDPALDTADWWEEDNGPGNLRVDYVLPAATLKVTSSGVLWSDPRTDPDLAAQESTASRHRLVWVDILLPDNPGQASPGSAPSKVPRGG